MATFLTPYQKFISAEYNGSINTVLTQATTEGNVQLNNVGDNVELRYPRRYEDSSSGRNFESIIPLDATITGIQYKFVVQRSTPGLPTGLTVTHILDDAGGYIGDSTNYSWTGGTTVFESAIGLFGLFQLLPQNVDLIRLRFDYNDDDPDVNNRFASRLFSSAEGPSIALRVQYSYQDPPKKITITGGTKVNIKNLQSTSTDYSYASSYGASSSYPSTPQSLLPQNNGGCFFPGGVNYSSDHYVSLSGFDWENQIFPSNAIFDSITIKYQAFRLPTAGLENARLVYRFRDDSNNTVVKLGSTFLSGGYRGIEDTITNPNFSFNYFNNFNQMQFLWSNDLADDDTGESATNNYSGGFMLIDGTMGFDPQIKINYTVPSPTKVILGS